VSVEVERCQCEGLPGFIFLGFIFYRGFIYFLRIYWDLLRVSVFQHTLILAPALRARPHSHYAFALTRTKLSPSGIMWDLFQMYEDLLKNPNKSKKNKSR
jgi:hypothetical protein